MSIFSMIKDLISVTQDAKTLGCAWSMECINIRFPLLALLK